jgi:CO/xanthine dehydrogenase Mo-binding subunit
MSELSVVGEKVPRVDAREKVTGKAVYVNDIYLPGMLKGKILHSPYPHARIISMDTSRAERLSGVRAVITAADVPDARHGACYLDQPMLAREKVRYVGDYVAAVAADDEEAALEACNLIEVEYQELPALFDPQEAMAPDAPLIHERLAQYDLLQPLAR